MVLSNKLVNKKVIINKLRFNDKQILHKLNNVGIAAGSVIKILDYQDSKNIVHILSHGVQYVLREKDCMKIEVNVIKKS